MQDDGDGGLNSRFGIASDGGEGVVAAFDPDTGALNFYQTDFGRTGNFGTTQAVVDGSAYFSVDPAMPEDTILAVAPDAPLIEPTPEQVALVGNVINATEARKSLCEASGSVGAIVVSDTVMPR